LLCPFCGMETSSTKSNTVFLSCKFFSLWPKNIDDTMCRLQHVRVVNHETVPSSNSFIQRILRTTALFLSWSVILFLETIQKEHMITKG
jgi:hypothetical protein